MSEVQRFWSHEASNIRCVREADFDRVTAERDAALNSVRKLVSNAERGKRKYQGQLQRLRVAVGQRNSYKGQIIALQQRLTTADERVDVFETALAGMLFAFDDGVGLDWSEDLLDFSRKLTYAKEFKAALKPAEGGGDEA